MTANLKPSEHYTIGLFDSGVGGLSVLRQIERAVACINHHNAYRFIYLGDTARCPYGNRDAAEIQLFVSQISTWLIARGADSIVMACNTSAALAGSMARSSLSVPVFDLIKPTAQYAAGLKVPVAILATASTVRSQAFSRSIRSLNSAADVTEIACPDLVPLVEAGQLDTSLTRDTVWKYTKDFKSQKIQAVVLGCTHYPFLREILEELLPEGTDIIDPAEQLASELTAYKTAQPEGALAGTATIERLLTVTGSAETFRATAQLCLRQELAAVNSITLHELENLSPALTPHSVTGTRAG